MVFDHYHWKWLRASAKSAEQRKTRVPLSIYVLWHPEFGDGPLLARTISDWCSGGAADIRATGQGIPVHFRSDPWRRSNALRPEDMPPEPAETDDPVELHVHRRYVWRRPIELDEAEHNVFVPLVDDHMVDDPSWRRDLLELARLHHAQPKRSSDTPSLLNAPRVHLIPIQITSAWARMPDEVAAIQAVPLRRWTDGGHDQREQWVLRIRRLVTQALVRLLRESRAQTLPTKVFLSHAKMDLELGPGVAEQLRDVAAGYGQIGVFYDENDLPSGGDWREPTLGAAANTAGFIAVLSDHYATRYWCRREIQQARTPMRVSQVPGPDDRDDRDVWMVRPSVVAVTMAGGWSRLVGELGTVPAIMWRHNDANHATAILDQLFREALIAEFQLLYARQLRCQLMQVAVPAHSIAFLTWTPDAPTLFRLRRQAGENWAENTLVVYPGHGFLPTEEDDLMDALGHNVKFCSFEQFTDDIARAPTRPWRETWEQHRKPPRVDAQTWAELRRAPIIALSSGDADDLAALGYDARCKEEQSGIGSSHIDVVVLRVCRAILQANLRIAYGGSLRRGSSFEELLYDTVAAMVPSMPSPAAADVDDAADPETPLENWVARPLGAKYTVAKRAAHAGLVRYYLVGDSVPDDATPDVEAASGAKALSELRKGIANRSCLTIAFAGKRWSFSGIMPGVAEEILCAMNAAGPPEADPAHVRVLLLGEYGGAVREMVRYILDPTLALPDALTLEGQKGRPSEKLGAILRGAPELEDFAVTQYRALARCLNALRAIAQRSADTKLPILGINVGQWREVMMSSSIDFTRRLLKKHVLPTVAASRGR